jgi:two-component system sensor histidine kinase ChvG
LKVQRAGGELAVSFHLTLDPDTAITDAHELTVQLEQHLRATEAFAADVSHEFKNPLASIRTAADMALEDVDPAQRRRFLQMIQRDVNRMERLLSEAREISRIDARLTEEERSLVRLDELVPTLVESFRMRLGAGCPPFDLRMSDDEISVFASADRLTQALENLIDNAVSFSPPGAPITISLAVAGDSARITIADRGPGIPEEHRERVFSRFFSYRPEKDPDRNHTGLGLALVRAIVESYGGSITAAPRSEGGTEMVIFLPLDRAPFRP